MIWFKKCPRCTGNLCQDGDVSTPSVFCLQCGFRSYTEAGSQSMPMDPVIAARGDSNDSGESKNTLGRGSEVVPVI
jgi:hypothetical protein